MVALLGFAAWWGARGRPPVRLGVVAMGGAIFLVPILRVLGGRPPRPGIVLAVHVLCVVAGTLAARELRHDPPLAIAASTTAYLVAGGLLVAAGRLPVTSGPPRPCEPAPRGPAVR
jgi:peptidoglycan/LPS O-acetylase OafA/YrhL